jgi:hypothetical protein
MQTYRDATTTNVEFPFILAKKGKRVVTTLSKSLIYYGRGYFTAGCKIVYGTVNPFWEGNELCTVQTTFSAPKPCPAHEK